MGGSREMSLFRNETRPEPVIDPPTPARGLISVVIIHGPAARLADSRDFAD